MRRRRLKGYWKRLGQLREQALPRDGLLKKLGAAQERAGRVATRLVQVDITAVHRNNFAGVMGMSTWDVSATARSKTGWPNTARGDRGKPARPS